MATSIFLVILFVGLLCGTFLSMYLAYWCAPSYNITDMTGDELTLANHANKHMSEPRYEGVSPLGKPLLRRSFYGYQRIFINGIYENFGLPERDKTCSWSEDGTRHVVRFWPTFVPYEMISGIYPVELETRYEHSIGKPHKDLALQIETKDCRTALLLSDWGYVRLLKALRTAMGSEFERFFRGDELLKGLMIEGYHQSGERYYNITYTYGDIHKHKLLRSSPGYARNRERGFRKDNIDPRPEAALKPRWDDFARRMKAMSQRRVEQ